MFVKTGDNVKVISGSDKGKEGKVLKVLPKANKVVVEGVNVAKKHQKPTNDEPNGGVIDAEMPIAVSNVALAKAKKAAAKKTTTKSTAAKKPAAKKTTAKKATTTKKTTAAKSTTKKATTAKKTTTKSTTKKDDK
ncbi:50S ribosomal protein L24 [Lactobacillus sp. YT155]|uniref:50S ribosomal protein L24 n=1 Tax=Lactobacillus sp. YT155 TaxID=3060955 RepID=UPI00265DA675|nr:50S ribosomal protein L24 [Lactobacillus sp. YT155]MDO1604547.1 50S ribosomal protein L24 [Lactobacillus sp. YT155]